MKQNNQVTAYIDNSPSEQQETLDTLRQLIHNTIPEASEDVKWGIPVFTKTKIFTYLRSTKSHVAIGFYNIDRIHDPDNLLDGTGKNMRHLKISSQEGIDEDLIAKWLQATAE